MSFEESQTYFEQIKSLMDFVIPHMIKDGRAQLVVAIGCTGGQHRSVTFANALAAHYADRGFVTQAIHRDAKKEG